jgi:hypothetical protein
VRPELWGRYAAGLNRLQGCLAVLTPVQQQQQQQQPPWSCQAATGTALGADQAQHLHQLVLQLLHRLEESIQQRKAPTGMMVKTIL